MTFRDDGKKGTDYMATVTDGTTTSIQSQIRTPEMHSSDSVKFQASRTLASQLARRSVIACHHLNILRTKKGSITELQYVFLPHVARQTLAWSRSTEEKPRPAKQ